MYSIQRTVSEWVSASVTPNESRPPACTNSATAKALGKRWRRANRATSCLARKGGKPPAVRAWACQATASARALSMSLAPVTR